VPASPKTVGLFQTPYGVLSPVAKSPLFTLNPTRRTR
jgi:hypothetical protein